ncbi:MAG: GNAT family N-acetyltransferase [Bacteroidia bacterium]|nr:GNAT family N-acetyltransferase [Bacteroidia bacterium]
MLKIRKASKNDAASIALLGRITFNESFGHLFRDKNDLSQYHLRTFSVNKIKSSVQKRENIYWVAFWDDLPVGYAKLKLNSQSDFLDSVQVCQLQKIYVLKDFLSMKIGLNLQEELLNEARSLGNESIWLSVWDGNSRAIRFYEKNGFDKIGAHDFQIGKENFDFIVMAKQLVEK